MPFIPPDYIDNKKIALSTVINRLISELEQTEVAFASGYFEPSIWKLIGSSLHQVEQFRLLLGRQLDVSLPESGSVDLHQYYRQKLQGELEVLQYTHPQAQMIEELLIFLRRDTVAVRLFEGPFLHAKAYIFPNIAIVGSSNLTPSGLCNNAELNLVSNSTFVAEALLKDWYNPKWMQSADYKTALIEVLEASKFGSRAWTPYEVFIKTLYEYFRGRLFLSGMGNRSSLDLAAFQQEGLREAIQLLDRYGGVLIADAVGLGKTFIGLGLLEHYLIGERRRGKIPRGLIVCPAQLKNTVWEPRLQDYQIAATILSMEELSRQDFAWKAYRNMDFVLVDESHNFRNSGTGRYRNLFRLLSTGKRTKKIALLSATPINNTVWDLYHQIMLLTKGQEDYYHDVGIANLRGFFNRVDKGEADLFDLLEETTVRRSRQDIRRRQEAGERVIIGNKDVHFPLRKLAAITYDLDGTYAGFYDTLAHDLEQLTLVSYNIEQFRIRNQEQAAINRSTAIIGLLKTLLLKRLESSVAAFEASLHRQRDFQNAFYRTLMKHNRLLNSAAYRQFAILLGGSESLEDDEAESLLQSVDEVVTNLPIAQIREYDLDAIETRLKADIALFDTMIARLDQIRQRARTGRSYDDKLERVKVALASEPLVGKKILVFSYYEQTARYLYECLQADKTWWMSAARPKIALLTGQSTATERKTILEQFAPDSNLSREEREAERGSRKEKNYREEEITILISTDVLSEGQNLQDAGALLNYDLHWNPVRMIQRAGRIDRIGSPHTELLIYNCFPEAELERLLGLVGRLQARIATIGRSMGNDASILGEVVTEKSLEQIKRLKGCDYKILEDLEEEEEEWLSSDEMRLPLVAYLQQLGERMIDEIPLGIHSGRGNQSPSGIFFAFQARDHHYWRFYEIENGYLKEPPITDKRRLFRMLASSPREERHIPDTIIWPYLEKATQSILSEMEQQQASRRLRNPMSSLNLRIYNLLSTHEALSLHRSGLWQEDEGGEKDTNEKNIIERLLALLQTVSLKPFERDPEIRSIVASSARANDLDPLIAELDAFAIEHDLYAELNQAHPVLEAIKAEDLKLVSYEFFSS